MDALIGVLGFLSPYVLMQWNVSKIDLKRVYLQHSAAGRDVFVAQTRE